MPRELLRAGMKRPSKTAPAKKAPAPKAKTLKKVVKAKPAAKPTPAPRKSRKKVVYSVCVSCPGVKSLVKHDVADMERNENGRLMCRKCAGLDDVAPAPTDDGLAWYVINVEPGREGEVRKEILKRVRINNLEASVKRVMSPSQLTERVGPKTGPVVAEGYVEGNPTADTYDRAREAGKLAAAELYLKEHPTADDVTAEDIAGQDSIPGFKVTTFPAKRPGFVEWKVRPFNELETVRKVVKTRKYPGYMLVNCEWTPNVAHLITKTRGVWGVLLQPVVTGHHIKISVTKPTKEMAEDLGSWAKAAEECANRGARWRVVTPDGGTVVAKGKCRTKDEARMAAEKAKAVAEEFKPTRLKDKEAAEALMAQKAVNQIVKDKEELMKAVVNVRAGDSIRVKAGAFRGTRGTVVRVIRNPKDKSDVKVECTLTIMDRPVPLTVNHHDVERTTKGDR